MGATDEAITSIQKAKAELTKVGAIRDQVADIVAVMAGHLGTAGDTVYALHENEIEKLDDFAGDMLAHASRTVDSLERTIGMLRAVQRGIDKAE